MNPVIEERTMIALESIADSLAKLEERTRRGGSLDVENAILRGVRQAAAIKEGLDGR